jgi:uncharacterized protein
MKGFRLMLLGLLLGLVLVPFLNAPAISAPAKPTKLPGMIVWSSYDVGSGGFIQAGAMANALQKQFGVKVRILPSGTSVGRLTPLKTGAAKYGFLADETHFALEGTYEFGGYIWGPQDLRVVIQHPSVISLVTAAKAEIKTPADFKGKRVAWVIGSPTLYVKAEAFMAFAGLTWNDVQKVEMPSYAAALKGLVEDKVDAAIGIPTASIMYELEASQRGIYWPEFPASDKEGWARIRKIAPWTFPGKDDRGAGLKKGQPRELPAYNYPQLVTYAKTSADEVYALVKALDETFGLYKDADPVMSDWAIAKAGKTPAGAPFHEGAIRYLKEKGIWKAEDEAWNKKILARAKKLQQAWGKALEEASEKKIPEKEFPAFWLKKKQELVGD